MMQTPAYKNLFFWNACKIVFFLSHAIRFLMIMKEIIGCQLAEKQINLSLVLTNAVFIHDCIIITNKPDHRIYIQFGTVSSRTGSPSALFVGSGFRGHLAGNTRIISVLSDAK